jgi:tRNA-uridine 2-sulfurtransferase
MRVLVAMSGGVDSSVAAALLVEEGHQVEGATLKLWGGESDSGCCSVADVDDARRVAQQLGIRHHVFNFGADFETHVVQPYIAAHAAGQTPNPCVECNRHLKFDRFLRRALQLGFDAIATGHHVRRVTLPDGSHAVARGEDQAKDQSYVVHMLGVDVLDRCLFPVGDLTKTEVRGRAHALGLRTADKAESMDVCFIAKTNGGRRTFLGTRIALRPAPVVDTTGREVGRVDAVELVTVGQRKGLGPVGAGEPRFVIEVDTVTPKVVVGTEQDLLTTTVALTQVVPMDLGSGDVLVQCSAHAVPLAGQFNAATATVHFTEPTRRVAPGQTVVLYHHDVVVGGGIAA